MARLSVYDERVRDLVDRHLIPLFFAFRSTSALCKALNGAMREARQAGVIHPNRLHAFFSDDVSRGLHEATVDLVERAVQLLYQSDEGWEGRSASCLIALRAQAGPLVNVTNAPHEAIARKLSVPPAVARHILGNQGTPLAPIPRPDSRIQKTASPRMPAARTPDWSFQDAAVSRSLEALRRRPTAKIGLVLPTAAGKTRTALLTALKYLSHLNKPDARVYWVTHLKNLRVQAHKELQKLLSVGGNRIPPESARILADQIEFVMVSQVPELLADQARVPALVIIDEAHHAAAPSYDPILSAPIPALFLTATPNRTDGLPIGIDEIAYTINYRELEQLGVIMMPQFREFPVEDFNWSPDQVRDLADYVIDGAAGEFTKMLVLAPRIERVEEFYNVLLDCLAQEQDHPLESSDIGFIYGGKNSLAIDNDDFLALFAEKPRAIIVSAQLLLEGYNDPATNTVVLTYPSSSITRMMQAAGRCVRYSPEKKAAYVVQPRNDQLAYYFDQRWLYQEISDYLRPELVDRDYTSPSDLEQKLSQILSDQNVAEPTRSRILDQVSSAAAAEKCRLLVYGFPYTGASERFDKLARWGAFLETPQTTEAFRNLFNAFCDLGAELSDPSDFLQREGARFGIVEDLSTGSQWRQFMELLTACYFAREEIYGATSFARQSRPSRRHGPTTWLRYYTLHFRPAIPIEVSTFLADCYNRTAVELSLLESPAAYMRAIKIPLPMDGNEAWLLDAGETSEFDQVLSIARSDLRNTPPPDQLGMLARFLANTACRKLPSRVFLRLEAFLTDDGFSNRVLPLSSLKSDQLNH
jgi:superfamily II DNA or RNA helicase